MKDISQYLHLFTPVTEGLPEPGEVVPVIMCGFLSSAFHDTIAWTDENGLCIDLSNKDVTHWLDLSKLTTKDRAERLSKRAHSCGVSFGYAHLSDAEMDFKRFILGNIYQNPELLK